MTNNDPISEYLNLIQDAEVYLDFIYFKLFVYENLAKYNDLIGGSLNLPPDYKESHEIDALSGVLNLTNLFYKTRDIRIRSLILEEDLYPMMANLFDKSMRILNSNPLPDHHEIFKLIFIRPESRNKIGIRLNSDDYDYSNITFYKDINLIEYCQKISLFIQQLYPKVFSNETNASKITRKPVQLIDFPTYLKVEEQNKEGLAMEIKSIFNSHARPKDFAIMLCVLSQNNIINIPNRKRKPFYISWYNFIKKELPKNDNFTAINKFILDQSQNGFMFIDESDMDYLKMKEQFERLITTNN